MRKRLFKRCLTALFTAMVALQAGSAVSTENLRGDVNCSGACGIDDLSTLINYLVTDATPPALWLADINGNGVMNMDDLTDLINYLVTGEWLWPDPVPPSPPEDAWVFTVNGVSFAMIHVDDGTFMMGHENNFHTTPVHQVTLSSYWIGETEVTNELWHAVMGEYHACDLRPVHNRSWDECQEFISRLNEMTGMTFSLPTEAQWEFAARGGNLSHGYKYSGSDNLDEVGWYYENTCEGIFQPVVKTRLPNELGLYDMSGGVWEFCQDHNYQYEANPVTDPLYYWPDYPYSPNDLRQTRGGDWQHSAMQALVWERYCYDRSKSWGGMRLALWPDPVTQGK